MAMATNNAICVQSTLDLALICPLWLLGDIDGVSEGEVSVLDEDVGEEEDCADGAMVDDEDNIGMGAFRLGIASGLGDVKNGIKSTVPTVKSFLES